MRTPLFCVRIASETGRAALVALAAVACFFAAIRVAVSQTPVEPLPIWRVLTRADGLGSNNARGIARDARGDIWFATSGGLTRFDGMWRNYVRSDGLPANDIRGLAFDIDGALWVATGSGAARLVYDGSEWRNAPTGEGAPTSECFAVAASPDGVWFGARVGLFQWDGSDWRVVASTRNYPVRAVAVNGRGTVAYVRDGQLGATPAIGLVSPAASEPVETAFPESANPTGARALLPLDDTTWWTGGTDGLFAFDGGWRTLEIPSPDVDVNALSRAPDGAVWMATTGGAFRFDGEWRAFTVADGLPSDSVQQVYEDEGGRVWMASANGVALSDGSWQRYTSASGLPSDDVLDLAADMDGNLWMATPVGLARQRGRTVDLYGGVHGLPGTRVRVVETGPDGRVWVGVNGPQGGLGVPQDIGWKSVRASDGIGDSNEVYSIAFDSAGRPWVGTGFLREPEVDFLGGVARLDADGWRFFRTGATPVALAEDARGVLWAGTLGQGLLRFDGAEFIPEATPFGGETRALLRDSRGFLWAGTSDGLFRHDGNDWQEFGAANALPGNSVRALSEDNAGRLWVCLDEGVAVWDAVGAWVAFAPADGIPVEGTRAIAETTDGAIWFAGRDGTGVVSHRPSALAPQTRLTRAPRGIVGETSALIAFDGGDAHTQRSALRYSYRLNGGAWTTPEHDAEVFVSALPQGTTVVFDVRAVNRDGVPDPTPARTVFYVDAEPPTAEIASPSVNAFVRGEVAVTGWAFDGFDFDRYRVDVDGTPLVESRSPARGETLALWDTRNHPDGAAAIQLVVSDRLDGDYDTIHTTSRTASVRVDNTPPTVALSLPDGALSSRVDARVGFRDEWLASYRLDVSLSLQPTAGDWRLLATESLSPSQGNAQERIVVWDTSSLDGVALVRLTVADLAGNVAESTVAATLANPDARPFVQLTAPAPETVVRGQVDFVGTVSDLSLTGYEVSIRAASASDWQVVASGASSVQAGILGRWNTAQVADGRYALRVRAVDSDGYATSYPEPPMPVIVDNTPPAFVQMTSPQPEEFYAGGATVTLRAAIRETNRAVYRVDYARSPNAPENEWERIAEGDLPANGDLVVAWQPPVFDGAATLRLSVIDAAGWEMPVALRAIRFDGNPPRVVIRRPVAGELVTGVVVLRGTVSDEAFAHYDAAYRVGDGEWRDLPIADPSRPVADGVLAVWDTAGLEGDAEVRIRATDAVGVTREELVSARVDNAPPTVSIAFPTANAQIAGVVDVTGAVADANLLSYTVEWRPFDAPTRWTPIATDIPSVGAAGRLTTWNAVGAPGRAVLRVSARDRVGHEASAESEVVLAPVVERRDSSFVSSVDGKARLFIARNALPASVAVTVNRVDVGATGALSAYAFAPADTQLDPRKPATLELDAPDDRSVGVALWDESASSWRWLGGTRDGGTLRLGVSRLGVYGLVRGAPVDDGSPFAIRCQPRAFSPNGGNTVVTFRLNDESRVTAKVFHGSGRLVAELADEEFRAGEHALVWDGRNNDGDALPNGIYIVRAATRFAASQTVVLLWNP